MLNLLNKIQNKIINLNSNLIICTHQINILKKDATMFSNVKRDINSDFFYIKTILKFLSNLFKFYLIFVKIFFLRIFFFDNKKIKSEIIFLSHKFYGNNLDLYFSDIKKFMRSKKKFSTLFIDQSNFYNSKDDSAELLKSFHFSFTDYFLFFFSIHKFFWIILKYYLTTNRNEKKIIFYILSSTISIASLRIFLIVFNLKNKIEINFVKKIVHTYEGHVYEKYLNIILKKFSSSKIETIGYQHTGLSGSENSILLSTNKEFLPKKIMCISNFDKEILRKKTKIKSVTTVGRHKKFNWNIDWKIKKKIKNKIKVLILIENNLELIEKFLKNHKNYLKKIKFTLRPHPEKLKLTKKIFKLYNVIVSEKQNYMQDLQDNDILIFENSTIHFEAIKCGLIVLKIVDQKKNINISDKIGTNIDVMNLNDVIVKAHKIKLANFKKFLDYSKKNFPTLNDKKISSIFGVL